MVSQAISRTSLKERVVSGHGELGLSFPYTPAPPLHHPWHSGDRYERMWERCTVDSLPPKGQKPHLKNWDLENSVEWGWRGHFPIHTLLFDVGTGKGFNHLFNMCHL